MSRLQDKVAIVTGASKGLGAQIAKHFAAEGASVVVNYASSKADGDRVAAEIVSQGGRAISVGANVAKRTKSRSSSPRRTRHSASSTSS
jgi:3-oxoacyl-[acyl-carrier protein] reductase